MKLLIDHSAVDVIAKQQNGLYPVLTAAMYENLEACEMLLAANADMCLTSEVVMSTRQNDDGKKRYQNHIEYIV